MKKSDAEQAFPELCRLWREARELPPPDGSIHFSFTDFKTWLREKHYSRYLDFRSRDAEGDAERWFNREMRQAWRD